MSLDKSYSFAKLEWDKIKSILISKANTIPGKNKVAKILPLLEKEAIRDSISINFEAQQLISNSEYIPFAGCSDILSIYDKLKIQGSILDADEINLAIKNIEAAKNIKNFFKEKSDVYEKLAELSFSLEPHPKLIKEFRKQIDDDGEVLDSASGELKKIRRQIHQMMDKMKSKIISLVRTYSAKGILREDIFSIRNGRYSTLR